MTFDQVLPDFKAGKKIRRRTWYSKSYYQSMRDYYVSFYGDDLAILTSGLINIHDIFADDWEVLE